MWVSALKWCAATTEIWLQRAQLLIFITNSYSCKIIAFKNKLDSKGIKNANFSAIFVIFAW